MYVMGSLTRTRVPLYRRRQNRLIAGGSVAKPSCVPENPVVEAVMNQVPLPQTRLKIRLPSPSWSPGTITVASRPSELIDRAVRAFHEIPVTVRRPPDNDVRFPSPSKSDTIIDHA